MVDLLTDVPRCVLAVYAHPDDAEVSCGGSLARWASAGAEVHLVVCTQGEKGTTDTGMRPGDLAEQRRREMSAAADVLGLAGCHVLGYLDGELEDDRQLRADIVGWVRRTRPETILCPDPTVLLYGDRYVNHRDHRIVGMVTLDAVAPAAARPLYFPDLGPPHQVTDALLSGTVEPSVWVDVADTMAVKIRAVSCHRSQFDEGDTWVDGAVRGRAGEEGRRAGVTFAEAFRRVQLDG